MKIIGGTGAPTRILARCVRDRYEDTSEVAAAVVELASAGVFAAFYKINLVATVALVYLY